MEEKLGFELKPVTMDDCRAIYEWRIHPKSRAVSRQKEVFPYESHETWFSKAINDSGKKFYVAWHNGERVGQIRYDYKGEGKWEANVTVDPEKHGKGYGSMIVSCSSKQMFKDTPAQVLIAEIMPHHLPSIRIFEKAGYKQVSRKTNEYGDWIVFHLIKDNL